MARYPHRARSAGPAAARAGGAAPASRAAGDLPLGLSGAAVIGGPEPIGSDGLSAAATAATRDAAARTPGRPLPKGRNEGCGRPPADRASELASRYI